MHPSQLYAHRCLSSAFVSMTSSLLFSLSVFLVLLVFVPAPDFLTSSFTCICCISSNFTARLTTTAQSAYKAPGTRTSSGISDNNDDAVLLLLLLLEAPSALDVEAEGVVELDSKIRGRGGTIRPCDGTKFLVSGVLPLSSRTLPG
jgi:hypothetical protein